MELALREVLAVDRLEAMEEVLQEVLAVDRLETMEVVLQEASAVDRLEVMEAVLREASAVDHQEAMEEDLQVASAVDHPEITEVVPLGVMEVAVEDLVEHLQGITMVMDLEVPDHMTNLGEPMVMDLVDQETILSR